METNKELMEAPADLGGDIFDLIREWSHRPEGQRGEVARSIIGVLNRSYMAGVKDTRELFALSQRSEAVDAPSDEMVIRGAEVLHDSLRHAGCTYDFDHSLKGTEIQQGIAEAVFNAMIEVRHQNATPAPSAAAGEQAQAWDADATTRLRSIVDLLGLQSSVPEGDLTGYEFAVLGHVRREIERLKVAAQPTPAQGDAVPVATKCAACNGEGWVRDIHDMEQGRIRCTKCATRQSSADAVDAARLMDALTPRKWTPEMSDAWHRAIPDVEAAFKALREVAQGGKGGKE